MKTLFILLFPLLTFGQDTAKLKGNGSDETATLQAAINKSSNLVILSGTYFIGKIGLHSNLTIRGNGAKLRMIQGAYDNIMISLWQANNVRITGLEIALNGIQGNMWDGTAAVEMYGCQNVQIDSCFIHDNTFAGVRLVGGNSNIKILHNLIQNTDACVWGNNLNYNVSVVGNVMQGGTSEGCVCFSNSQKTQPYNWTIDSNIIISKAAFGINIPFARLITVTHNTITGCMGGVMMHDSISTGTDTLYSSAITIANNLVSGTTYGIINVGDSCNITANTITGIVWDGIQIGYPNHVTAGTKITGNTITNAATIGGGTAGVNVTNSNYCTVTGNKSPSYKATGGFGLVLSGDY